MAGPWIFWDIVKAGLAVSFYELEHQNLFITNGHFLWGLITKSYVVLNKSWLGIMCNGCQIYVNWIEIGMTDKT